MPKLTSNSTHSDSARLKLLVVEDDPAGLELMAEVLSSLKAEVRAVGDSQKAAALVIEERFDGIFLDLEMPNLHGFDLARRVRSSSWNKTTPIIVVTGSDDRKTMQDAFAAGATFFLQKPVDRKRLIGLFQAVRGGLLQSRRRSMRVPLQTEVTCEVGSRTVRGMTWNLSQGGVQVEAPNLKSGDAVRISFRLPVSEVAIEAAGTVAWASENRQGIRFTNVNAKYQEAIRAFVEEVGE
jgi:CheY-like chemotaxis protein